MQLSLLLPLLAATTALAAECGGQISRRPTMNPWWRAREQACKHGDGRYDDIDIRIAWEGNRPSTQLCWDATENMFNQCVKNGWLKASYTKDGTKMSVLRKRAYLS
ncbi:hypothetical protein EDC01DRAFT_775713 [Geopyxis carbonaria]|nr:hypothetical protein EDC01DRAFT_775713 [Geopyxis carbonaria]